LKWAAGTASLVLVATRLEDIMAWKKPRIVEISLALEINGYACAEIG
jgi:coenzyme PQQ precursor peptide PqqA